MSKKVFLSKPFRTIYWGGIIVLMMMLNSCGGSKEVRVPVSEPIVTEEPVREYEPAPDYKEEIREETPTPEPLVLTKIFFDFDADVLTEGSRDILAANARALKNHSTKTVEIQGHCDERGTIEYNLALGGKRAQAVMNYLTSLGVNRSQLKIISYGKEKPVNFGHNEAAWTMNRRAEFVVRR